jgi:transposase
MNGSSQNVEVWLVWLIAVLVSLMVPLGIEPGAGSGTVSAGSGVVIASGTERELFPWVPRHRWRKHALKAYRRARHLCRQARYRYEVARGLAYLARHGVLTLAWLLDRLTRRQMRYYLGALPLLYTILTELRVAETVNRFCPSRSQVSHGEVALVLVLNRLHAPRALWRVADWLAQTTLVQLLGVEPGHFNKDRLARTLDALAPQTQQIWQAVVNRAIERYDIDLSVIYYDLTAFVLHGEYEGSDLVAYGFAHNTASDKQKVKTALNAADDGNLPLDYQPLNGSTADKATVEANMERLTALLKAHGSPLHEALIVGDRAMLDDRLALLYDAKGLRYLAGLAAHKKVHRQLLELTGEAELRRYPLGAPRGRYGYWGKPVAIFFEHDQQRVFHRGLVMLSGPMRFALYRSRAQQFRALWQAFGEIQAKADANQSRYRSPEQVQKRAETQCRQSKVGRFVTVQAAYDGERIVLTWQVNVSLLRQTMAQDGRYLLATNDPSLSPARMFELYRAKDGVEKDFRICKSQLKVSPLFLHKDERIEAMLLLNMLALLAYTLLERQARQSGLQLTTRYIIEQLEPLTVIETECRDGSRFYRLTPLTAEQADLLARLRTIFPADAALFRLPPITVSTPEQLAPLPGQLPAAALR